jgi:hypothetical protein
LTATGGCACTHIYCIYLSTAQVASTLTSVA